MTGKLSFSLFILLLLQLQTKAQTQSSKELTDRKTTSVFKIDGKLDEPDWKTAPIATSFVELNPVAFRKEELPNRTEIYFLYNNTGLLIGGYCHEQNKDSIATELIGRDNFGNNDFIGFVFDTYNDKTNATEYFVTPLGEQMDAKIVPPDNHGNSEDFSWSSVWESATKIQADGWTFELFIPYSALRFSKKDQQVWGMNIVRKRNKSGKQLFWAPIDPTRNGFLPQEGIITIPEKVNPPLRLSFTPYFSTYFNNYPYNKSGTKNTTTSVNGGMDLKYGINESFTLDATLVPDFGQVQSDNQVLNLTPFETKFNENRSFFTEGTELFNKGNLFYSRRVGSTPLHYNDLNSQLNNNEHILKNPSESRLINAVKLSGRTKGKLGIGIFNAVSEQTFATIEDANGLTRKIQTNPLTNYNIIVLDQNLKNNSTITFVNTDVWRKGKDYDANVSAGLFNLFDKKNKWNLNGNVYSSTQFGSTNSTGYKYGLGIGKVSGHFNVQASAHVIDDKFDPNDLGIQFYNNDINYFTFLGYSFTKPTKWYNKWYNNVNFNYERHYKPNVFKNFQYNYNGHLELKNLWSVGANINGHLKGNDFYEPRINGRVFHTSSSVSPGVFFQTNESKKYAAELNLQYRFTKLFDSRKLNLELNHRFQFSKKFSLSHYISYGQHNNNAGFDGIYNSNGQDTVLFGRRDRTTVENRLNLKYSFNTRMYLTMRIRHYWSTVNNKEIYLLNTFGDLDKLPSGNSLLDQYIASNHSFNRNLNLFNVDMVYTWRFAPGSEFNIVWKNGINTFVQDNDGNYFKNFRNTLGGPENNNISLKVLYYVDYLSLKRKMNS